MNPANPSNQAGRYGAWPPYYPPGTEPYSDHLRCTKNLAGTHKGNRYCLDHKVAVADEADDHLVTDLARQIGKEVAR